MRKVITNTTPTMQLAAGSSTATASTGNAALAPQQAVNGVVQAPNTLAHPGTLAITGTPSTAKTATNGIGPAPGPRTVGAAALACIAAAGTGGATLVAVQAAITAVGLKGKHPVMPLLRWLAANRGYSFTVHNGTHVTMG